MKTSIQNWQIGTLVAASIQFLSPGITSLLGLSVNSKTSDPLITPAGYAFTIWGVITFLAMGYAIYQAGSARTNRDLHQKVSKNLSIIYVLFAVWVFFATLQWILLTVMVFVTMFWFLTIVFQEILKNYKQLIMTDKILLLVQVAVYTGWTTVAIFANTASAIKFYGISDLGILGMAWQSVILVLALGNSIYWLRKFQRNLFYGLAILWAFVGVYFGVIRFEGTVVLQGLVLTAMAMVLVLILRFDVWIGSLVRK